MGLAFLGSQWLGAQPLAQRLMEPTLASPVQFTRQQWLRVNLVWVVAYLLLGGLNLYVANNASEQAWVYFKVFGLTMALVALGVGQALWLQRRAEP
jgi:intracellular septation protein